MRRSGGRRADRGEHAQERDGLDLLAQLMVKCRLVEEEPVVDDVLQGVE
jgi:hypothetical protein